VKETVKDYVPVDSESVTHNMCVLLTFQVFRGVNGAAETQCGAEVIVFNFLNNIRSIRCWQEPCDT
jgi:hypothetical protein